MSSPYDQASGVCNRCGRSHFHTHDSVTTAATTSHEHTEACQNATEVKRQLLTELLDGLPEEYTGWTNFGKHDLNYPEEGYNKALTEVTSVIQALLDGLK